MQPGLNKVVGPIFFGRFKRFWHIGSYRPITASNGGFKKEPVFKKPKLVTQVEVEVQGVSISDLFFILIQVFFKRI